MTKHSTHYINGGTTKGMHRRSYRERQMLRQERGRERPLRVLRGRARRGRGRDRGRDRQSLWCDTRQPSVRLASMQGCEIKRRTENGALEHERGTGQCEALLHTPSESRNRALDLQSNTHVSDEYGCV